MRCILLDGAAATRESLARQMGLPDSAPCNLDALADHLSETAEETAIILQNPHGIDPRIPRMLRAAAAGNGKVRVYGGGKREE